jgi:nucleoside-diphosphate-sugar epimerase
MLVNSMGTYNVVRAAVQAGVKVMVAVTSNAVLGHTERISGRPYPIHYLPIDEEHPREPENSYALSKSFQEQIMEAFTRGYGIRSYALRPAWIWRPELQREHAEQVGPTEQWSDRLLNGYVDTGDVARCVRMCLEACLDLPPYDAYYVGAADTVALEDSLELVRRFRPDLVDRVRDLPGRSSFISSAKAARGFGWKPKNSWTRFRLPGRH